MRRLSTGLALLLLLSLAGIDSAMAQDNIAKGLLDRFVGQTDGWWEILRGYALFLFTTTLTIEVGLFGIRMALQRADIAETTGQFITVLLFAGFIAAVIMNYQEWATGIAIKGLYPLTGQLTGNSVDAGQPVAMAAAIMDKIIPVMDDAGITDFGEVYLYVSCMLIIMVVFILISALVILTTCEFYIVANVGVLLIGLGGSRIFKDYAVNVMRYVLSVALKLFVLQLIVNIGFAIISLTDLDATVGNTVKSIKFVDLFFLIGKAIILLALAKVLPETCAGLLSGAAAGGGNPVAAMGKAAGTMALGAATAGVGLAAGTMAAVKDAHTIAREGGARGVRETVGSMIISGLNAGSAARAADEQKKFDSNPGSIRNQLRSAANASRAARLLEDGGENNSSETSSPSGNPGGSGQPVPQGGAPEDSGQSASQGSDSGGSSQPAPQGGAPGGSGQLVPQGGDSSGPTQSAPQNGNPGGSGQSAPQGGDSGGPGQPAASEVSPTSPKPPKDGSTAYHRAAAGEAGEKTVKKPREPVDMRTFDPSIFNNKDK